MGQLVHHLRRAGLSDRLDAGRHERRSPGTGPLGGAAGGTDPAPVIAKNSPRFRRMDGTGGLFFWVLFGVFGSFQQGDHRQNGDHQAPGGPNVQILIDGTGHSVSAHGANAEQHNEGDMVALAAVARYDGDNAARQQHDGHDDAAGTTVFTRGRQRMDHTGRAGLEQHKHTQDDGQNARNQFLCSHKILPLFHRTCTGCKTGSGTMIRQKNKFQTFFRTGTRKQPKTSKVTKSAGM